MTTMSQIKGVLFDLDGVITDTARLHSQAWQTIAKQVGATWTPALADQLKGIDRMQSLELILAAANRENDYTDAQKQAFATAKNERYLDLVAGLTPTDIEPGIRVFLDSLQQHGYRLALASSSKNAPIVLQHLGLAEFFTHIVDPAKLEHGKPAPDIYEQAAAAIDLAPEACLGIEDAASGVASINAAGATAVGIGDPKELAGAAVIFPDTASLTLTNLQRTLGGDLLD